ncbi:hypothetical protein DFH11DRAFT_1546302 [Phellopilus nigrolimitatus]|nr:hypothetical protein DFH11DRAFT_1763706 [Phellopilus nigrolimitatus]KAH8111701.1 hypothetical protein DFH11DRAFT_1546302 [Phellopilus nigrolimitatus]
MLATGYSTLFSLGLSTSSVHCAPPVPSPHTASYTLAPPPKIHIDTQVQVPAHPRVVRRRRSSVAAAAAASPKGALKSPARAAGAAASAGRAALRSPSKARARKSDGDAQRARRHSMGDVLRSRRGPVSKSAPAPPDMPLPAVPSLSLEHPLPSPARPPSSASAYRRAFAERDSLFAATPASGRFSLPAPPSATSASSSGAFASPQLLLTPGFAAKLAHALATPPGSPLPHPQTSAQPPSPVDPVLGGRAYFDGSMTVDEGV